MRLRRAECLRRVMVGKRLIDLLVFLPGIVMQQRLYVQLNCA